MSSFSKPEIRKTRRGSSSRCFSRVRLTRFRFRPTVRRADDVSLPNKRINLDGVPLNSVPPARALSTLLLPVRRLQQRAQDKLLWLALRPLPAHGVSIQVQDE